MRVVYADNFNNKDVVQAKRLNFKKLSMNFLILYFEKTLQLKKSKKKKLLPHRQDRISAVYNQGQVFVNQGRTNVRVQLRVSRAGYCFGEFAATKKPFNFRPKKIKVKR